jgi:D-arabinose 1-dehydrogenase-like Zn-dependent alcohol dehydrogenase
MFGYRCERIGEDSISVEIDGQLDPSEQTKLLDKTKLLTRTKAFTEMEEGKINGRIVLDLR